MAIVWCYWPSATKLASKIWFPISPANRPHPRPYPHQKLEQTGKRGLFAFPTSQRACLLDGWSPAISPIGGVLLSLLLFFPTLGVICPMSSFILIQIDLKLQTAPAIHGLKLGQFPNFSWRNFLFCFCFLWSLLPGFRKRVFGYLAGKSPLFLLSPQR